MYNLCAEREARYVFPTFLEICPRQWKYVPANRWAQCFSNLPNMSSEWGLLTSAPFHNFAQNFLILIFTINITNVNICQREPARGPLEYWGKTQLPFSVTHSLTLHTAHCTLHHCITALLHCILVLHAALHFLITLHCITVLQWTFTLHCTVHT